MLSRAVSTTRLICRQAYARHRKPPLRALYSTVIDENDRVVVSKDPERFKDETFYRFTRQDPDKAFTMPPESYYDEDFFKVEQEQVFRKGWVCVGTTDQLKEHGDTIVAELAGQPIFVTKGKDLVNRAFYNVCRHRGAKMVRQNGRYAVISCPYHRWGYSLTGKLLGTPMWNTMEGGERYDPKTGERLPPKSAEATEAPVMEEASCLRKAFDTKHLEGFDKKDYSLFDLRVETLGCMVFVNGDKNAPPLSTSLGSVGDILKNYNLEELITVRSKTYESTSNWKLLAENFMEYYHLPSVHPALTEVSKVDDHHRLQGPGQYVGFITRPLTKAGTPIDPDLFPPFPNLSEEEKCTGVFHHLFPNVFYFLWPHQMFVVHMHPESPTKTIEKASLLIHPRLLELANENNCREELEEALDKSMAFYDMTNQEDIDICELVQEGVKCKAYKGGRVSFRFEETIHRFQNILIDYMCGDNHRIPLGDEDIAFYTGKPHEYVKPLSSVEGEIAYETS